MIERGQYLREPLNCDPAELGLRHLGELSCGKARELMRATHADLLLVEHFDDLACEDSFELQHFGIRIAEIAEYVAASTN